MQEYLNSSSRFWQELLTHIYLFGGSIIVGNKIGVPLGIWAAKNQNANRPIFFIANITQTIPNLALFGMLSAPLFALSAAFPSLQSLGLRGKEPAPVFIALIIYS